MLALAAMAGLCAPARARAQGEPAGPRVIDRVMAVVRIRVGPGEGDVRAAAQRDEETLPPDVITRSGLEFEARVAMISRGATGAATAPLDDPTLKSALDNAIWERLLAGEADVLQAFRVEPSEVDAALRAFKARFESEQAFEAFLQRSDVDLQGLEAVLRRSLRAARALDSKVRLRAQVSEAEVHRAWEENPHTKARPYEEVRAALREKLFRDRYQALVRNELAQLERAHEVRRIAPLAQGRGG